MEHRSPFTITSIQEVWQEFYRKYFRMAVDFSDVVIPDDPGGFERVIFIPKGLTFAQVIKALCKQFKVWLYTEDLDIVVTENVRSAKTSYAVRFRERQEADEELKNRSYHQLMAENFNGITLLERLVYELKYWSETGQHLDVQNITLCVSSRHSGGSVPDVDWDPDCRELRVDWCPPDSAGSDLRARQAVSS